MDSVQSKKVNKLVDLHIRIDPPAHLWRGSGDCSGDLLDWARQIKLLMSDHRSADRLNIEVVKTYEDQCSICHGRWETQEENGETYCFCCGATITEA